MRNFNIIATNQLGDLKLFNLKEKDDILFLLNYYNPPSIIKDEKVKFYLYDGLGWGVIIIKNWWSKIKRIDNFHIYSLQA